MTIPPRTLGPNAGNARLPVARCYGSVHWGPCAAVSVRPHQSMPSRACVQGHLPFCQACCSRTRSPGCYYSPLQAADVERAADAAAHLQCAPAVQCACVRNMFTCVRKRTGIRHTGVRCLAHGADTRTLRTPHRQETGSIQSRHAAASPRALISMPHSCGTPLPPVLVSPCTGPTQHRQRLCPQTLRAIASRLRKSARAARVEARGALDALHAETLWQRALACPTATLSLRDSGANARRRR